MNAFLDAVAAVAIAVASFALGRRRGTTAAREDAGAAAARVESDARDDRLMQALPIGVIQVDDRGRITAANVAASVVFDFGSKEVVGRAIIEAVPSFDLDRRVRDALDGHLSRGGIVIGSGRTSRILSVSTMPIEDRGGAFVIAIDETRIHELEQSRREFVSSISHELRTPLSSIKLMLETVLAANDQEARDLFLPQMMREVDRMVQLVEDFMELARAEVGRLRLRREEIDLADVAERLVDTLAPRAGALGIDLVLDASVAEIDGDEDRLAQVIVNLVDNALRHTSRDGRVTVTVRREDRLVTLAVRDTGEGIPFNDLPHVFERFYVVERSRTREAAGTGLGLAIVKLIVEAHGGTVEADSELGVGSTFVCRFPAIERAVPAVRKA